VLLERPFAATPEVQGLRTRSRRFERGASGARCGPSSSRRFPAKASEPIHHRVWGRRSSGRSYRCCCGWFGSGRCPAPGTLPWHTGEGTKADYMSTAESANSAQVPGGSACRLAVYGSLAPGRPNRHRLSGLSGRWIEGTVRGRLLHEGWGAELGYPGRGWTSSKDRATGARSRR
jgi:hypothetical protein